MEGRKSWQKALLLSALLHGLLFVSIGFLSAFAFTGHEPDPYIELELVSEAFQPTSEQPAVYTPPSQVVSASVRETVSIVTDGLTQSAFDSDIDNLSMTQSQVVSETGAASGNGGDATFAATPASAKPSILAPHILQKIEPLYPEQARQKGWEGKVTLKIEVLPNGLTGNIAIVSSSGYTLLDDAAVQAIRQWRFAPAKNLVTDQAMGCLTVLSLFFKLH